MRSKYIFNSSSKLARLCQGDIQVEEKLAAAKATAAAANAAGWAAEEKARAEQKSAAGKGAMMIETHGMRRHGQSLVQVSREHCSRPCPPYL